MLSRGHWDDGSCQNCRATGQALGLLTVAVAGHGRFVLPVCSRCYVRLIRLRRPTDRPERAPLPTRRPV